MPDFPSTRPLTTADSVLMHFRSQEPGARSQEPGARSQEPGARSQEPGARSQEPGARSQEPGARSQEPGARSQEPGARSQEPGARSQEPGARSQEPGARSQEPGARSQEPGARSQGFDCASRSARSPSRSESQSSVAALADARHSNTPHPQERSRDMDRRPDRGRGRDSSRRRFARSLAALTRRSAAGLLLLLATLLTVPAQAQQAPVPGAPTDLTATAVGATTINLAWTAPADNGGDAIIGYQIEVWVAGGMHWAVLEDDTESTGTDYAHTGLMDGRTRYYRVAAINSVGAGATSNVASATTTDMMAPQFSGNAGDTSVPVNGTDVLLQFDESLDRGAGRVPLASAFTVTADGVAIAVDGVHVEGTVVRLALDGVITRDQSVTVSYRDPTPGDDPAAIQDYAGNDAASFADHTISNGRNKSVVLGAPTNLTATGVSATQIDLSWEAPAGFTPTGYRIEVSTDGGTTWTDRVANTGSTATDYSHTGLTLGDTRHYRVSAISGTLPAVASNVASATAFDAADTTPPAFVHDDSNSTRVSGNGHQVTLGFNEALDGRPGRLPPASAFTVTADGSTVTVTAVRLPLGPQIIGLDFEPRITDTQTVTVSYRDPTPGDDPAAIQDYAGNDAASFTDQAISNFSEVLPAPTNLTATGVSATQIDLSWEAPAGFTPTGYRIEVSTDGGTTWTDRVANTGSTATAYSHTGLTLGDTRHYRVSVSGTSPAVPSNVASATAFDAADTTPPAFVHDDSNSTRVSGNGHQVTLGFNEALDGRPGRLPPASAFTVTADGSTVTVTAVRLPLGPQIIGLDFEPRITDTQTVTVSYRDPTPGDDPAAIQDYAGNDAASFTDQAISNFSEVWRGPTNLRATRRSLNWTDLSWQAPADFVPESYRVEGQNLLNIWTTLVAEVDDLTDTVFSHYDPFPEPLYPYRYRVWAVSSTVESVVSNTAAAGPDRVPPVFDPEHRDTSVLSDGTAITLQFSENLLIDRPPWSAFTVTLDGIPVQQGRIIRAQDQIRLTGFESPIGGGHLLLYPRSIRRFHRGPYPTRIDLDVFLSGLSMSPGLVQATAHNHLTRLESWRYSRQDAASTDPHRDR